MAKNILPFFPGQQPLFPLSIFSKKWRGGRGGEAVSQKNGEGAEGVRLNKAEAAGRYSK